MDNDEAPFEHDDDDAAAEPAAGQGKQQAATKRAAPAATAAPVIDTNKGGRRGHVMEISRCTEACDSFCGTCAWDMCTVVADHSNCCDVVIVQTGERHDAVPNRYLRAKRQSKRQRPS